MRASLNIRYFIPVIKSYSKLCNSERLFRSKLWYALKHLCIRYLPRRFIRADALLNDFFFFFSFFIDKNTKFCFIASASMLTRRRALRFTFFAQSHTRWHIYSNVAKGLLCSRDSKENYTHSYTLKETSVSLNFKKRKSTSKYFLYIPYPLIRPGEFSPNNWKPEDSVSFQLSRDRYTYISFHRWEHYSLSRLQRSTYQPSADPFEREK